MKTQILTIAAMVLASQMTFANPAATQEKNATTPTSSTTTVSNAATNKIKVSRSESKNHKKFRGHDFQVKKASKESKI